MGPSFGLKGQANILAYTKRKTGKVYKLTNTVATLFGKAFARIEEDAVIAASKLIASVILSRKHIAINTGPSGTWSKRLKKNKTILKYQIHFTFLNCTHRKQ